MEADPRIWCELMCLHKAPFLNSILIGCAIGLLLLPCRANAGGELHIFNWSQHTSPFLIQRFAEAFDVHVPYDEFRTIEDFLETVRAGNAGLDVVVASD